MLFWTLMGCGTCGPWSELRVNQDNRTTGEHLAQMWAGVDQLAAWTEREQSCVKAVRFLDPLGPDSGLGLDQSGDYTEDRRVLLNAEVGPERLAEVTRHQFCHAIDEEEGWVSLSQEDALANAASSFRASSLHGWDPASEVFARTCASGPQGNALLIALAEQCPDYQVPEHLAVVQQALFPSWTDSVSGRFDWTQSSQPLLSEPVALSAGSTGDALVMALWHPGDSGTIEPELIWVDVDSAALRERLPLPTFEPTRDPQGNPRSSSHSMVPSTEGLVLLAHDTAPSYRVQIQDGALGLESLDVPDLGAVTHAVEDRGRWLYTDADGGLFAHADGTSTPLGFQDADGTLGELAAFFGDAEGALVAWTLGPELVIEGRDHAGQSRWAWRVPLPSPTGLSLARTPEGQVLLGLSADDEGVSLARVGLLLDPNGGQWALPQDSGCTQSGQSWLQVDGGLAMPTLGTDGWALTTVHP